MAVAVSDLSHTGMGQKPEISPRGHGTHSRVFRYIGCGNVSRFRSPQGVNHVFEGNLRYAFR